MWCESCGGSNGLSQWQVTGCRVLSRWAMEQTAPRDQSKISFAFLASVSLMTVTVQICPVIYFPLVARFYRDGYSRLEV